MELSKEDYVNMICGTSALTMGWPGDHNEGLHKADPFVKHTGNQWNTKFDWDRDALADLSIEELIDIYKEVKEAGIRQEQVLSDIKKKVAAIRRANEGQRKEDMG